MFGDARRERVKQGIYMKQVVSRVLVVDTSDSVSVAPR